MWTCNDCGNQSEDNYRFCWSCGKPKETENETAASATNTAISFNKQTEDEPERNIPQVKAIERENEIKKEPLRGEDFEKPDPEITIIEPVKPAAEKKAATGAETPPEAGKIQSKPALKSPAPELFATFLPESERGKIPFDADSDWESIIFTTAVRILGLYFIFLVLTAIPQFASLAYFHLFSENSEIKSFSDLLATDLFGLAARLLFYLIAGIYLIASGRILLRMLARK